MTKYLISAIVIVILAIGGGGYLASTWVPVPSGDDIWNPENALILDTAKVPGSPRAYLFWYDAGAFGYTIRMVSLGTPSHEHALIESNYLTAIHWTAPDTLVVELWKNDYRITNDRSGIAIRPHIQPD
jgi:hypothetical protein